MEKDFKKWHKKKSNLDKIQKRPFFHEREIWYVYVGTNVGFEQDGEGEDFLRPVVIIRKFNNEILWAVPLTKSHKILNQITRKYYFQFSFLNSVNSRAILSQIRLIDARRLSYKIGEISESDFRTLIEKLKELFP